MAGITSAALVADAAAPLAMELEGSLPATTEATLVAPAVMEVLPMNPVFGTKNGSVEASIWMALTSDADRSPSSTKKMGTETPATVPGGMDTTLPE